MLSHSGVSIYYVPRDGEQWAKYTEGKLSSEEYGLKCILNDFTCQNSFHVTSTAVNVFFITPDFLEHKNWESTNGLNKDTCVIILTGVDMIDLEHAAKLYECEHVLSWYILELEQSEESVREMILSVISVYESTDPLPHLDHATGTLPRFKEDDGNTEISPELPPREKMNSNFMDDDPDMYDKLPCDVRQVNRSIAAFRKDGIVYLLLERKPENGVRVEVDGKVQQPKTTTYTVYTLPSQTGRASSISVFQGDHQIGKHEVSHVDEFQCHVQEAQDRLSSLNQHHVATQTETPDDMEPPRACPPVADMTYMNLDDVKRDSSGSLNSDASETPNADYRSSSETSFTRNSLSKLDQIRELLRDELDPVQLLCRCLKIKNDVQELDERLTSLIESTEALKNIEVSLKKHIVQDEKTNWPTLVHFGARFNLISFCNSVLSNPIMHEACLIRNKNGHLPVDIARDSGHAHLANILEQFTHCVRHSSVDFIDRFKRYDSGLSGFETPRLSTVTLTGEDEPPTPHLSFASAPGYVNMNIDGNVHTGTSPPDAPFGNITEFPRAEAKPSIRSNTRSASTSSDVSIDENDGREHQRKDLNSHLGISTPPPKQKRKHGFFARFRSHSSSEVQGDNHSQNRKKETKSYKRDSPRSSGTSSSTASITSETSLREIEEEPVQLRQSKKKKDKGNLANVVNSAKRRQSMRVRRVMRDQNLTGPTLPERRPRVVELGDL